MKRTPLKTYSHLAGARRMPNEYEISTTRLLYYVERGFEVDMPLADWYRRHQAGSPLRAQDWERFRDPRQTTYTGYTARQAERENHVDGILRSIETSDYDQRLDSGWLDVLERVLSPLRFLCHGMQMVAAYVGHMAPSSRLTITAAFQAADEVRRIQRIAQRMAQLRRRRRDFGADGKEVWQEDLAWQPLRRELERLMVTWDWGEALVGLNLCLKPIVDRLFMVELPVVARSHGDYLLGEIFFSLDEDCQWHREWAAALVATAFADDAGNREVVRRWVRARLPDLREAAAAAGRLLGDRGSERSAAAVQSTEAFLGEVGAS